MPLPMYAILALVSAVCSAQRHSTHPPWLAGLRRLHRVLDQRRSWRYWPVECRLAHGSWRHVRSPGRSLCCRAFSVLWSDGWRALSPSTKLALPWRPRLTISTRLFRPAWPSSSSESRSPYPSWLAPRSSSLAWCSSPPKYLDIHLTIDAQLVHCGMRNAEWKIKKFNPHSAFRNGLSHTGGHCQM
jgi:hypothetical protein